MPSRRSSTPEQVALDWAPTVGLIAGVDEAGRGPLAGPVVAAAVILDELQPIAGLADSKKLTARQRDRLYDEIRAKALCCCIAEASVEEIDRLNILHATMLAMKRAVEVLCLRPTMVQVDGNRVPALDMPAQAIVKGDAKVQAISAASILAKVHRDRLCLVQLSAGDGNAHLVQIPKGPVKAPRLAAMLADPKVRQGIRAIGLKKPKAKQV